MLTPASKHHKRHHVNANKDGKQQIDKREDAEHTRERCTSTTTDKQRRMLSLLSRRRQLIGNIVNDRNARRGNESNSIGPPHHLLYSTRCATHTHTLARYVKVRFAAIETHKRRTTVATNNTATTIRPTRQANSACDKHA